MLPLTVDVAMWVLKLIPPVCYDLVLPAEPSKRLRLTNIMFEHLDHEGESHAFRN